MNFDHTEQLRSLTLTPPEPPKPEPRSAWGAIWRAPLAAAAGIGAHVADLAKGFGQAYATTLEADPFVRGVVGDAAVQRGAEEARRQIDTGEAMTARAAEPLRQFRRDMLPDPQTAGTAEKLVFGVAEPMLKLVGAGLTLGPAGIVAASGEIGLQQADDLREQGVDFATRAKVGALSAAATAASAFLPMAGSTLPRTAALYVAGGPGSFVAQQAATRAILERADYGQIAEQFDPLDRVGLPMSFLIPLPFAGYGAWRNIKSARAAQAPDVAPAMPKEAIDAAMVHNLTMNADEMRARQAAGEPPVLVEQIQPIADQAPAAPLARLLRQTDQAPALGRFADAYAAARDELAAYRAAGGTDLGEFLAARGVAPEINNLAVGLSEVGDNAPLLKGLLRGLAREAENIAKPAADATADAVEGMRNLTVEQLADITKPAKPSTDPLLQSITERVTELERSNPDLPVRQLDDGRTVKLREELAEARRLAREGTETELGTLDADLVRVAAECALSFGGS